MISPDLQMYVPKYVGGITLNNGSKDDGMWFTSQHAPSRLDGALNSALDTFCATAISHIAYFLGKRKYEKNKTEGGIYWTSFSVTGHLRLCLFYQQSKIHYINIKT